MKCYASSSRLREHFENSALNIVVDRFLAMSPDDGEEQEDKREEVEEDE